MPRRTSLPAAVTRDASPYHLPEPGWWLVLCDVHVPCHCVTTLHHALADAKRYKVKGVLINGDLLDSHEISVHDKDPSAPRYAEEVRLAKQFLSHLRSRFPKVPIVYKEGNHDDRLKRYVARHAPALFGLPGVDLPSLLELANHGVTFVEDKRVVRAGRLNVLHGHEYPGGSAVNAARSVYLKAGGDVLVGHFHRASEHCERAISGEHRGAWSVGCCCALNPSWLPLNQWVNGWAMVHFCPDGEFRVENKKRINGRTA